MVLQPMGHHKKEQLNQLRWFIFFTVGEVMEALQMDSVYFKEKYNQDMPYKSDHVVFSCLAGVRSKQALAVAKSLGFSK